VSDAPARIRVLPADLADQIAAGEVVERPASVVKELVDNAVDAGATRVEVDVEGGGVERICVVDDGRGIAPDDLALAVLRHATSKLGSAAELAEPKSLGFRGEALASIAAVASLEIASRPAGAAVGTRLRVRPGLAPEVDRCGMAPGTRVEVRALFANVPARRKFLRAAATEIGHCSEALQRIALVHPEVALRLRHDGRTILDLPRVSADDRVVDVLARRGADVTLATSGVWDGIRVRVFLGAAARERGDVLVVVRRRVVRERAIAQIVRDDHRRRHGDGEPVACAFVEPPSGTVDVNVHPQKAEVRFSDPQAVYAALRRALAHVAEGPAVAPREPAVPEAAATSLAPAEPAPELPGLAAAAASEPSAAREPPIAYRLETRAALADYAVRRDELRTEARTLAELRAAEVARTDAPDRLAAEHEPPVSAATEPELLACLPGPVAIASLGDEIVAVDLRTLRTHLVQQRIARELGAGGVVAQALLVPAVVRLAAADAAIVDEGSAALAEIGVVAERFGDDAVLVRAVPAALRGCVDEVQVGALVERLLPWLRLRARGEPDDGVAALARAVDQSASVVPRLARNFLRELVASGTPLERAPGVRVWTAAELVERDP
jgi:DNA mismatch repair protein MutL